MIRKIINCQSFVKLTYNIVFKISTKEEFHQKFADKEYYEILGIKDKPYLRGENLRRAYLSQIKKFHPDQVQNPSDKANLGQITKVIIAAYDQLQNEKSSTNKTDSDTDFYTDEDEVAQIMFGKRYNLIKHTLYAPGNEQLKNKFIQELAKRKNRASEATQQTTSSYTASPKAASQRSQTNNQGNSSKVFGVVLALVMGLSAVHFLMSKKKEVPKSERYEQKEYVVKQYTAEQMNIIMMNASKIAIKPYQRFLNSLLSKRPHILKYPSDKDPHILKQLIDYSIAPDIHLYEVSSDYFLSYKKTQDLVAKNSDDTVEKYQLTETKPNTLLTLSLQAERMLHNIYIPVDDVLKEIKEKGKYTPPKIFFRFNGYMMFEIRDKPISTLQNYKNSRYISLFDLFFDYYTPIFFKRTYYNMYLIGFDQEPKSNNRYFGNVKINWRKVSPTYIDKNQKIVLMRPVSKAHRKEGSKSLKQDQMDYRQTWENYYANHEKNWKKFHNHQAEELQDQEI